MKKILLAVVLFTNLSAAYSQKILNEAQETARKENKFILVNFSGSDWCIPCMQMQKEYFDNTAFIKMADSQLVIIRADFPRKKKNLPSKEIVIQNEQLAEKFNKEGSFPLTILMDSDLKIVHRWEGKPEEAPAIFTNQVRSIISKKK